MARPHRNPVYAGYFADPFVWNRDGIYYAVGTGELEAAGHAGSTLFPVLQSENFFEWHLTGNAMARPEASLGNCCWAPAVACSGDVFYLYYSVGHGDKRHQLRVAKSNVPTGPYTDLGIDLLDPETCSFAIDPHPFRDDDGRWYLFYATDFLEADRRVRAGTALMVAPLENMTQLGEGRTVLRATQDWQRFQANRLMYGRHWDWHTLEGPCAWKHAGKYYCFYSAGRWENESYGVDYGVADNVMGPYTEEGNEEGPRVLHTVAGQLIGPGHNTITTGPDGENEYIIYHAWDPNMSARKMFIDRLAWTPRGPRCDASVWLKQSMAYQVKG